MRQESCRWIAITLMGFVLGCADTPTKPVKGPTDAELKTPLKSSEPASSSSATTSSSTKAAESLKPVDLVDGTWSDLQTLVGEQKGKLVVVDVWSTACEPCMKEFPNLITLQKKYPNDVVAISFDIDYAGAKNKPPAFYRERVLKFLGSQVENSVLHRMCTTAADDLFTEIKLDSIPAVYVYDREGALAKRFDGSNSEGEVSYEKLVVPFVDGLLK